MYSQLFDPGRLSISRHLLSRPQLKTPAAITLHRVALAGTSALTTFQCRWKAPSSAVGLSLF